MHREKEINVMAYELNLTTAQYEAVYEINLDYLMSLNGHGDVFGIWWDRRNADLRFVLNSWQFDNMTVPDIFLQPFLSSERCPSLFKRSEMLLFNILCQE